MHKSQNDQSTSPYTHFEWFCLAVTIESFLALAILMIIPADPKNVLVFGYSLTRVLIMILFLGTAASAGFLTYGLRQKQSRAIAFHQVVQQFFSKPAPVVLAVISAVLGILLTGWLIIKIYPDTDTGLKLRLLPILVWLCILCIQVLGMAFIQYFHLKRQQLPAENGVAQIDIVQLHQVLVYLGIFLLLANITVQMFVYVIPRVLLERFLFHQTINDLTIKFSLGIENNIPSGFYFALLLICAGFLFWLGASHRHQKSPWTSRWFVSGFLFLTLAMDKMTSVHPYLVKSLQKAMRIPKAWRSNWYLVFLPLVIILILWCWPLIRSFAGRFQKKIWLALALMLGGGVGIDLVWSAMRISAGSLNFSIELVRAAGDAIKWGGTILLSYALAELLLEQVPQTRFILTRHREPDKTVGKQVFQFAYWQPIVILTAIAILIVVVNLFDDFVLYFTNKKDILGLLKSNTFIAIRNIFDMDEEAAFPNTFSIFLLFSVAVLSAIISGLHDSSHSRGWKGLSVIFFVLSLDEAASLHNSLVYVYRVAGVPSELQNFFWVVPLIPILIFLSLVYLRFWLNLPNFEKVFFILSGIIYIAGAAGVEVIGGMFVQTFGKDSLTYAMAVVSEEMMEIGGMILFLFTLFHYVQSWKPQFEIQLVKNGLIASNEKKIVEV
jgi:hypothetical protein